MTCRAWCRSNTRLRPTGRPLHVHLSEQPAENQACQQFYGCSPTEQLHRAVQRKLPSLSLATVYKNLEALKAIGAVADVNPLHQEARYELSSVASRPSAGTERPGSGFSRTGEEWSARIRTSLQLRPSRSSAGTPMITAVAISTACRTIP